jgi:tetratricopeptide (TPR) repeat protein
MPPIGIDGQVFLEAVRPALEAGDAKALADAVGDRWQPKQVASLLNHCCVDVRRVAAVALGLVGDACVVGCLARALRDPDEKVNEMAEYGLWSIWFRSGDARAAKPFREGVALLGAESYEQAIDKFLEAQQIDPDFAEAYNQCAIAHFFVGDWMAAIDECRECVKRVSVHFGAISGMGHCYTQLGDLPKALHCYRQAISINPRMPAIARAIERLEARIRDINDSSGIHEVGSGRV